RVIAPDQLGFGGTATGELGAYSPPPNPGSGCARPGERHPYGREAWTDHALALLDALDVPEADVIGNSMGGAIALSMAVARPSAIRRIVLMGTMGVAMALPPGLNTVWGYEPTVEGMREIINLFAYNRG